MSNANRPKVPLSAETYERRECILEAFEDAWRRGERPNLTDYLPATGPDRLPLLVELAHEELDHRIKAGESARVEDYLRRYPDLERDADAVVSLVAAEWQLRGQRTKGTQEEYLQRFAAYREKLLVRLSVSAAAELPSRRGSIRANRMEDEEDNPATAKPVGGTLAIASPIGGVAPQSNQRPSSHSWKAPGSEARPIGWRQRCVRWLPRIPVRTGILTLLGLGLVVGYVGTYKAYRTANARRIEAERADLDKQMEIKQEQAARIKAQEAVGKVEAAREEEGRRRRRAEAEREHSEIALYSRQLADARRLARGGEEEQALAVLNQCRPDLRHWEWGYLRQLCRHERAGAFTLDHYFAADEKDERAASLSVLAAVFTPDGKSVVSVASDSESSRSELRLWNLATGRSVRTYPCPGLRCSSPYLSADGRVLAVHGIPKSGGPPVVRLWKTDSGEKLPTLSHTGHDIVALAFGPDGSWLVTRGKEGTTRVWEVATGKERCHCGGQAAANADVAVSPDGKQIVSVGGSVKVLDPATCKDVKKLPIGDFQAVSVAYSPDGKWLALSGFSQGRQRVGLWHPASGQELLSLEDFGGKVFFSPEGRYLAALGSRVARLWDSQTGRTRTVTGMGSRVIHPDGRRVLLHKEDHFEIRFLESPVEYRIVGDAAVPGPNDTSQAQDVRSGKKAANTIPLAAIHGPPVLSGDGRRLAATYEDGRVRVWDLASARQIHSVPASLSLSLGLNHDGTRLVTAGPKAGTLVVWDVDRAAELCRATYNGTVTRLTFSRTGGLLAVSTVPNRSELRAELGVWETATGKNRFTLSGASSAEFLSVVILPDEKQILDFTPGRDSAARAWDLLTGQPVTRKMPFSSSFPPVFSPDGGRIACYGTTEGKARAELCVADVASGTVLWSAHPDSEDISGLAFSPDGRRLAASCAKGGRLRVWETETGQEVFTLSAHAQYADAVRFTSDGQSLLTLGLEALTTRSSTVKRWDGPIPR